MSTHDLGDVRILVIDDEPGVRHVVSRMLQRYGIPGTCVGSAREARSLLETDSTFHIALVDRDMPDEPGEAVIADLRRALPDARVVYFTGEPLDEDELTLVDGIITKPLDGRKLVDDLRRILGGGS